MTDYEFEAFKKGFSEGCLTMWAIFDIANKDLQEKFPLNMVNSKIYKLYQLWQNTIKDDKIKREESILAKKVSEKIDNFKNSIMIFIRNHKI